ncbi:MAG: formate--tetrahydrofolate ligase [Candidatus Coatesbacteria bacterium]|nr:formate--tetrahydrofolate ligase [Candidatus Coatesbacteria bacterium]
MSKFPSDIEIAQATKMLPITEIAGKLNLTKDDIYLYGDHIAKVHGHILRDRPYEPGRLVLVSAITPTKAGEGKTTTTIGLSQGLAKLGQSVACALREPSLGPIFGIKGGAAGGGYSQVVPMEDINLHFTGDFAAIAAANNLLAAAIDNHIYQRSSVSFDPRTVTWRRCVDMNDRALRDCIIGLGGRKQGVPRETGFIITAASEVMAVLCLAQDFNDLKHRFDNIFIGFTYDRKPVLAKEMGVTGAMAMLMKQALRPNLVQTLEGVPAFIHGGPFANIAHGCNSLLATKMALSTADWAITEAGFGFDLGAEKFFDIKCQYGKLCPSLVVLVATCRALKLHGGKSKKHLDEADPEAVAKGLPNLEKHLENIAKFNLPAVVCVNRFPQDTPEELQVVLDRCAELGVAAAVGEGFTRGGDGMRELAQLVIDGARDCSTEFKPLYDWEWSVEKKIETICGEIYGAEHVEFTSKAKRMMRRIKKFGYDKLPICMAKTPTSLSDNPRLYGRPKDFIITVRDIRISAGSAFLVPLTGDVMLMPGLPKEPAAYKMNIDDEGNISGLF